MPGFNPSAIAAQLFGEILQQTVGINIMGVSVVAGKGDALGGQDRHKAERIVGSDLFDPHMGEIAVKRLFLVAVGDDHQAARGQVAAVAQVADGGLVQRLHRGRTVILFDQRGRPARGVIAKRFFPFDHRDFCITGQARRGRDARDAAADDKDIGCVFCHSCPLSLALVSRRPVPPAPRSVLMGDMGRWDVQPRG